MNRTLNLWYFLQQQQRTLELEKEKEDRVNLIKTLKDEGKSLEQIMELTGLLKEEIEKIY